MTTVLINAKMLEDLDNVTAIAVDPGNAGVDEYMRGMANGLLLAQSIFKDTEPKYISAPSYPLDNCKSSTPIALPPSAT